MRRQRNGMVSLTLLALVLAAAASATLAAQPCDEVEGPHGKVTRCACSTAADCQTVTLPPVRGASSSEPGDYTVYETTKAGARMAVTHGTIAQKDNGGWQHISINTTVRHQEVLGFGGALTDAVALDIAKMKPAVRTAVLQLYFGATGARYSVGRTPIASCDFSLGVYSYDELPAGVASDFSLEHFTVEMDEALKLPLIRDALATAKREQGVEVNMFASAWAPPLWMTKENSSLNCHIKGDVAGPYYKAWADYYVRFFSEYAARGVPFWGLTTGNEPGGNMGLFQSLRFDAETQRDFVKLQLGPAMKRAHPHVKLMILDDQRSKLPKWADTVLADPDAARYVDGVGVHWYAAVDDTLSYFGRLSETHEHHPSKFILATEACEGYLPFAQGPRLGSWSRGQTYAHDILNDLENWAVGWTDWNICLDMKGGPNWVNNVVDAPVLLNTTATDSYYVQPMFYHMAHFSRFIPSGSVRVGVNSQGPAPMETTAFLTPNNQLVVVVLNRDYLGGRKFYMDLGGGRFVNAEIPAAAIQTFVFKPSL